MPVMLPADSMFLIGESREHPMHVGGLQLYKKPAGVGPDYVGERFRELLTHTDVRRLMRRRPADPVSSLGQLWWANDDDIDLEYHVRLSALPRPGKVRQLLELVSRLHGTLLDRHRPLWEAHLIEGLRDGRVALYTKLHHSLVDGISAMRLLQSILSSDPDDRGMPAPWANRPRTRVGKAQEAAEHPSSGETMSALRTALGISADAAGIPKALVKTLNRSLRNETSTLALYAPRTILNTEITASRRFAAQDWPLVRIRAIGKATGTTMNDVVLAMCSGAMRTYLAELDALPDTSLIAMVPVGLHAKSRNTSSGGNAVGSIMVKLGTDLDDPLDRLLLIHTSMLDGKHALSTMTPLQILALSAV